MEEALLGSLFAGEELNIVDEQQIRRSIARTERVRLALANGREASADTR